MLDVPGHESGYSAAGRTLRLNQQSQLRRPPGSRRAHALGEPDDGCCRGHRRALHRYSQVEVSVKLTYLLASPANRTAHNRKNLMQPFRTHTGLVAPLDRVNVDTDQIIPKQFLKRIERSGFGEFLFFDWRHTPGKAGQPFVLDHSRYRGSSILLAGKNFG